MSERGTDDRKMGTDLVSGEASVRSYEQGVRHEFGYGAPWDLRRAAECYESASDGGLPVGHYRLGRCYEYGLGVSRDLGRALWHYRAGASSGHGESSVCLGRFLSLGISCERDLAEARACFDSAAGENFSSVNRWLAVSLQLGAGSDLSDVRAQYLRGALGGDVFCQARAGYMCLYGIGGQLDAGEGLGWCEAAARGGDLESQFLAGMCLLEGLGTSVEDVRGQRWLELAASSGHETALALLSGRGVLAGASGALLRAVAREKLAGVALLQASEQSKVQVQEAIEEQKKESEQTLARWKEEESERTRLAVEAAVDGAKKSAEEDLELWKMLEEERTSAAVTSAVEAQKRESDATLNEWKAGEARRIQAAVDKALSEFKAGMASSERNRAEDDVRRLKQAVSAAVEKSEQASAAALASWKAGEAERTRQAVAKAVEASRQEWEKAQADEASAHQAAGTVPDVVLEQPADVEKTPSPKVKSEAKVEDQAPEVTSEARVEDQAPEVSEEYAVLEAVSPAVPPSRQEVSVVITSEPDGESLYRGGAARKASGDLSGAASCFEAGSKVGDSACMCALGECYERGEGCEKNDERAASLYRESADLGNPRAKLLICRYEFSAPVEGGGGSELDNFEISAVGAKMLWCQRGTFQMGSPKGWFGGSTEKGRNDNEHRHQVTLSNGFWLGKYQIIQREYGVLAEACKLPSHPSQFTGETLPVDTVSWEDCQVWCEELTRREREAGRLPDHYAYRLPTEAEWEYACRAGSLAAFNDGQNMLRDDGVCESLQKLGWFRDNSNELTHDVGLLKGNGWGFHDMHGNVSEWCYDKYEEYSAGVQTDPLAGFTGRRSDTGLRRVRRGGSWQDSARDCRCASRSQGSMNFRRPFIGFRIALGRELPSWRS